MDILGTLGTFGVPNKLITELMSGKKIKHGGVSLGHARHLKFNKGHLCSQM